MSALFRQEVIEARRDAWLGQVRAVQPIPIRIAAWVTLALVVFCVIFVYFGGYTRRVHAAGTMMPPQGLITVGATSPGIVADCLVTEGQHVKKDQPLFVLNLETTTMQGSVQVQMLKDMREQRALLVQQKEIRIAQGPIEKQSLINQVSNLARQHRLILEQIARDNQVLPIVQRALDRMKAGAASHLITETQLQNQLSTYAQLLSSHAQFMQNLVSTEGKISEYTSKLETFDKTLARDVNEIDRQIAQIDQQIHEGQGKERLVVRAPEAGSLAAIRGHVGQQVTVGTPLLTLFPAGRELNAEFYVTSASIGFVHLDDPVLLRYAAYPYQKFGMIRGKVVEVTRAPVPMDNNPSHLYIPPTVERDQTQQSGNNSVSLYRIRVRPEQSYIMAYGEKRALEPGMEVAADIAIDRRRLYQWMLSPVISVKESVRSVIGAGL